MYSSEFEINGKEIDEDKEEDYNIKKKNKIYADINSDINSGLQLISSFGCDINFFDTQNLIKFIKKLNLDADTIFDFDFNSQEFESEFKSVFTSDKKIPIEYLFDSEFQPDPMIKSNMENFIDLYKYFGIEIDLSEDKINKHWNWILSSSEYIEKYPYYIKQCLFFTYKILSSHQLHKIYDTYYLEYHFANCEDSDWKLFAKPINLNKSTKSNGFDEIDKINKINQVYSNLFEKKEIFC